MQPETGRASIGVEVVLIPEPVLVVRSQRLCSRGDVLEVVAVNGDQTADTLGPEGSDDAGCPAAPVVADQRCPLDLQRVQQTQQICGQRALLARSEGLRIEKAGRTKTASVRDDHPPAIISESAGDGVVSMDVVRKAVEQDDGFAGDRPRFEERDLDDRGSSRLHD